MISIHILAQLLVIVLAFSFFAALFYEIGKREAQKKFADEMLKEYARGVQDSDNWWIRAEEESESFLAIQHGSGENALGWGPTRKTQ